MKLGVAGLGQMGLPVAAALVARGHEVLAFDPDDARTALAVRHGATAASRTVALRAPTVLTLLPNDDALAALCTGPDGLQALLPAGGVHLCLGTLGVPTARRLAREHAQAGQGFIACPVFGRPDEAWARDLTAVLGASAATPPFAAATAGELLACVAARVHVVGSPEAACAIKLAGNQMIAGAIATMAECFGLAAAHGVDAGTLHAVVTGKLFRGPVYEGVGRVLAGAAPGPQVPGFTLRLGLKDLVLCGEAAAAVGHAMPVAGSVRALLAQVVAAGHADRDWSELTHLLAPPAEATVP